MALVDSQIQMDSQEEAEEQTPPDSQVEEHQGTEDETPLTKKRTAEELVPSPMKSNDEDKRKRLAQDLLKKNTDKKGSYFCLSLIHISEPTRPY